MKINCVGTLKADIYFDGSMIYCGMHTAYHPLQEYIDKATDLINEYGFISAQIVDSETGEIIVEMESDYLNDFFDDGPAYYDDGDTCGYE